MYLKRAVSSPWVFVPILFMAVGLSGGGIIAGLTGVMFKDFGFSNKIVGAVAFLFLPSTLRFFWAPWVDGLGSKRTLCIRFSVGLGFLVMAVAGLIGLGKTSATALFILFFIFSLLFSCLEVSADGYYIRVFDRRRQAEFVGVKAAGHRAGIIICLIVFVRLAGEWRAQGWAIEQAWALSVGLAGLLYFALALIWRVILPIVPGDERVLDPVRHPLIPILKEYFTQPRIWAIVSMLIVFRFGQAILVYMSAPFYMDPAEAGGFGLNAKDVALLKTFTDVPWMILGGVAGGLIIKQLGLRRVIIPYTLLLNLPNFGYVYLACTRPEAIFTVFGIAFNRGLFLVSSIESLTYGIGFSGFFYYIHAIAQGRHRTSMLAISSGLMGLGFYLTGGISGILQHWLGYPSLFFISSVVGLLTLVIIPFLPIPVFDDESQLKSEST